MKVRIFPATAVDTGGLKITRIYPYDPSQDREKKKKKVYAVGENDKEDQNRLHKKPNEMSFRVPTFHFQHDGGKNTVIIQSGGEEKKKRSVRIW